MKKVLTLIVMAIALNHVAFAESEPDKQGVMVENVSVAPNGRQLVFSSNYDRTMSLWIANIDGSNLIKVKNMPFQSTNSNSQPAWSPNGNAIAFVSRNSDSDSGIYLIQPDGKLILNGLPLSERDSKNPSWSPDGKKIVYSSSDTGKAGRDIWIMNADGTGKTKVIATSHQDIQPRFSPSGDRIVYVELRADGSSIKTANVNGSDVKTLISDKYDNRQPNWGVGGIVFTSNRDPASLDNQQLWLIQPDGNGLRKVGNVDANDPVWLNQNQILFTEWDWGPSTKSLSRINMIDIRNNVKSVVIDLKEFKTPS
ncbi:PD40 domain-containing protein [Chitinivorax sp. B]|uniref:TolB family protein n=1 Tax=Chitinivorax sp. B TaxID=2502235 RepID=UPI0010F5213C|nr:PD40 domain-containing protein [Chitinivorax sp. B]